MAVMTDPKALITLMKRAIPKLSYELHKGQCGRIGVLGGSEEYTGAPYFAGISALKTGADLVHIICPPEASLVIKSYSPELIVHPIVRSDFGSDEAKQLLERINVLILGPGLGRRFETMTQFSLWLKSAREMNLPMVIDADGLYFLTKLPNLIQGCKNAILTPNVVEFRHLYSSVMSAEPSEEDAILNVQMLSEKLGNVTVVRKGKSDIISNGHVAVTCDLKDAPRRCGGQGDLLSGSLGTFLYWSDLLGRCSGEIDHQPVTGNTSLISTIAASYAACSLTRTCGSMAYETYGRSLITTNLIERIHDAFTQLFE
ncbi:unnamed protein product [Soboliphyme baturini]|uniref:ATP-dependent (S)-NAD(P)H-hydrate dehydratase n=1 Tax=Soboliphyme baturini TaxID=241478 RepID=A0A183ILZ9_9BILA|nr:unnamed protein product [Soboliphyme baturini]